MSKEMPWRKAIEKVLSEAPGAVHYSEHTLDRFSSRWDRFSWFGLLPVSDKGILGEQPESYNGPKIIPAIEAILIEALEPRQNRKRGDDLSAVEYIQKEDPEIQKKKLKQAVEAAVNKM